MRRVLQQKVGVFVRIVDVGAIDHLVHVDKGELVLEQVLEGAATRLLGVPKGETYGSVELRQNIRGRHRAKTVAEPLCGNDHHVGGHISPNLLKHRYIIDRIEREVMEPVGATNRSLASDVSCSKPDIGLD